MSNDGVTIRKASPAEIASFVVPTWLHSYALSYIGKLMRADSRHGPGREKYWANQRAKIERILSTSTTSVRVAVFEDTPIGWICDDEPGRTIHFIFCGRAFRRQGVAKSLVPAWWDDASGGTVYCSHLPPPFYSRPAPDGSRPPWREHVAIDLVTAM